MPLRVRSEQQAAAIVAAVAGVLYVVALIVELPVAMAVVYGLIIYFAALFIVRRFVAYRIKPMYQILHNRNAKSTEIERQHKDVVGDVRTDLQAWAEQSSNEIARLKENEQYRKEFVGNVSHELKTPLFSIQGYILTLLDGGLEDEDINRKYLLKTESNIERLINIVKDLEEISKLESATLVLDIERFDIIALVHELVESVELQASERQITIKLMCDEDANCYVTADRKRISQVLINLLTNSIKYGKDEGLTKIHFVDIYDKVMIEVEDNGMGLDKAVLPRIFERFYRVDKGRSRSQGGTGLGLAIVKHIIEAHHQTITVRSTPEVGTTFSFTLDK